MRRYALLIWTLFTLWAACCLAQAAPTCSTPVITNGQASFTVAFGTPWHICWQPVTGPTGVTISYNLYRAAVSAGATCSTQSYTLAANNLSAASYTDNAVGIGNFCYYATSVGNGAQSPPSANYLLVTITPPIVSGLNANSP